MRWFCTRCWLTNRIEWNPWRSLRETRVWTRNWLFHSWWWSRRRDSCRSKQWCWPILWTKRWWWSLCRKMSSLQMTMTASCNDDSKTKLESLTWRQVHFSSWSERRKKKDRLFAGLCSSLFTVLSSDTSSRKSMRVESKRKAFPSVFFFLTQFDTNDSFPSCYCCCPRREKRREKRKAKSLLQLLLLLVLKNIPPLISSVSESLLDEGVKRKKRKEQLGFLVSHQSSQRNVQVLSWKRKEKYRKRQTRESFFSWHLFPVI